MTQLSTCQHCLCYAAAMQRKKSAAWGFQSFHCWPGHHSGINLYRIWPGGLCPKNPCQAWPTSGLSNSMVGTNFNWVNCHSFKSFRSTVTVSRVSGQLSQFQEFQEVDMAESWQKHGCVWKCWLNPEKTNGFADHYPYEKWLFHWEYTEHFRTNPAETVFEILRTLPWRQLERWLSEAGRPGQNYAQAVFTNLKV